MFDLEAAMLRLAAVTRPFDAPTVRPPSGVRPAPRRTVAWPAPAPTRPAAGVQGLRDLALALVYAGLTAVCALAVTGYLFGPIF
jgi:hypothetical protein